MRRSPADRVGPAARAAGIAAQAAVLRCTLQPISHGATARARLTHRLARGIAGAAAREVACRTQRSGARTRVTGPMPRGWTRTHANHAPLTPLSFLLRTAAIYPERIAVVHGRQRRTYRELLERCSAAGLGPASGAASGPGDTVAAMLPNIPAMLEAHYGVPMCGAVLNALNTRLDAGRPGVHAASTARPRRCSPTPSSHRSMREALRAGRPPAPGDRRRRPRGPGRRADRQRRLRGAAGRGRSRLRAALARPTNGRRSRSTTPRAPPAIPRAWSTTIAARI